MSNKLITSRCSPSICMIPQSNAFIQLVRVYMFPSTPHVQFPPFPRSLCAKFSSPPRTSLPMLHQSSLRFLLLWTGYAGQGAVHFLCLAHVPQPSVSRVVLASPVDMPLTPSCRTWVPRRRRCNPTATFQLSNWSTMKRYRLPS